MSEKSKRARLMVLNEPDGRRFSKALALEIGRDHAEVFLQIEYLISISTTPMKNDKLWTRDSLARLQELQFPYWGKTFIANILKDLTEGYQTTRYTYEGEGRARRRFATKVWIEPLLEKGWFNWGGDTTTWYTLNLDGISKLTSVQMDNDAAAVAASRKRVSRNAETGFPKSDNPFPPMRQPVAPHADDFHTETPTEIPTEEEVVVPEFPPLPEFSEDHPAASTSFSLETRKEFDNTHPILTTRTFNFENTEGRAVAAARVYRLVRPSHVILPTTDTKIRTAAESVLLAYLDRFANDEAQAADTLRVYSQAWDVKYPTSQTNLAWLTEWAASGSIPQKATPKPTKPAVVISDAMYCEVGKPLFNATLDETSPDFSKHYRAWMSHQADCEQCQGKKKSAQPVSTAPRTNPLKTMQSLSEGKSI